jgi:hypothetical protein
VIDARTGALVASTPSMYALERLGFDLRGVGAAIKSGKSIRGLRFLDAMQPASTGRNREG